ncbi:MAG: hypothetical protein AB8I08_04985 [Sandaracinaceae bacterium]
MIRGYEIAAVGHTPDRAEGRLSAGGLPTYGVRRTRDGEWVFVPLESVSLTWAARRLWSFRWSLREGRSGVGYEDYVWSVERFRLDPGDHGLEVVLEWSHRLETRPPGTPDRLAFVRGTARRIVQLRYSETDFPGSVFLALDANGGATEFEARTDALAHLGLPEKPVSSPDKPLPSASGELGALGPVLASPDDDDVRRRYASLLGGDRGEYITLSLVKKPTKAARARMKELLTGNRASWSAPLGLSLTGQRWARGFVVRAVTSTSATPTNLSHPEWGFVEEIPGNSKLPPPDRMDMLASLGTFNAASWLRQRRSPWSALRSLMVRLAEAELIASERERFPALEEVTLFVKEEELVTPAVLNLGTHIRSLSVIGPPPRGGLTAVMEHFSARSIETLTYAPHDRMNGGIALSRGEDGGFRVLSALPRTSGASVLRWLHELPHKSLDRIASKLSPEACEPWMRR